MKILYFYSEVMGYTMATLRALAAQGAELHVVHWDHLKLSAYQPPATPGLTMYKRSVMDRASLQRLADIVRPNITVVSGWMDNDYVAVAKTLRAANHVVVAAMDGQWHKSLLQVSKAFIAGLGYFNKIFSHAWVCGPYQYEFARRLGFKKTEIIFDLYSADLDLFHSAYRAHEKKTRSYSNKFLFVGRLEPIKGIDTLLNAWELIGEERCDWELHLIGDGSLKAKLRAAKGVIVKDFMPPKDLIREVTDAGCFVLPSRVEPWGVVVHEFAAAGLPLILSDAVGAASVFLIRGQNGYAFETDDTNSLMQRMRQIIRLSARQLMAMGELSHSLSFRISPVTSAANLLSVAKD